MINRRCKDYALRIYLLFAHALRRGDRARAGAFYDAYLRAWES